MPIVSGSNINSRLGGNVDNIDIRCFSCLEAAIHSPFYFCAVAVEDINAVHHRDSAGCLSRTKVPCRACELMIDGLIAEVLSFDHRKLLKTNPGFCLAMHVA